MLTVDHMYYSHGWEKFTQPVQTQLSWKPKIISDFFNAFFKSTWNFTYFEKKDQLDGLNILKIIDSRKCTSLNTKILLFQNTIL